MLRICYSAAGMLIVLFLISCSSQSRYTMLVPTHFSKAPDCEVEVFRTGHPSKEFVRISRIDVHIERTYYIRSDFEDVLSKLRKEACESGADAIIEIQERSSNINLSETNIYHVTATGIKYKQ
jgi:hypothetical protein